MSKTVTMTIDEGSDSGRWRPTAGTGFNTGETNITMDDDDAGDEYAGFGRTKSKIPAGAKILSAILRVDISSGSNDSPNHTIQFNDADDAVAPTNITEANALALTTASTTWAEVDLGIGTHDSPELIDDLQEVVDRGGFDIDSHIMVVLTALGTTTQRFRPSNMRLIVEYTTANLGGPISAAPAAWYQFDEDYEQTNEANPGTYDLEDGSATPAYDTSPLGIEQALDVTDGGASYQRINGTDSASCPLCAPDVGDVVTGYMAVTMDGAVGGSFDNICGDWLSNTDGSWRIRVQSNGAVLLQAVFTDNTTTDDEIITLAANTFDNGDTVFLIWQLTNESGASAEDGRMDLWAYSGTDGSLIDSGSVTGLGELRTDDDHHTYIGAQEDGVTEASGTLRIDTFALWTEALTSDDRDALVNYGLGLRYRRTFHTSITDHYGGMSVVSGLFDEDRVLFYMGDSYGAQVAAHNRPFAALMHVVDPTRWTEVFIPYRETGLFADVASDITSDASAESVQKIDISTFYEVEGGADRYGLPVYDAVEVTIETDHTEGSYMLRWTIQNDDFTDAEAGEFEEDGVHLSASLIYRKCNSNGYPSVDMEGTSIDLTAGVAGQANASPAVALGASTTSNKTIDISTDDGQPGSTQYVDILGIRVWKTTSGGQRLQGLAVVGVADDSFTLADHGRDTAYASSGSDKGYSEAQLRYFQEAIVDDTDRDITAAWFMDLESRTQAEFEADIDNMLDQFNDAATAAGLTGDISHLVVVPWGKWDVGDGVNRPSDSWAEQAYNMRLACQAREAARSDMAWVSIYDYIEGYRLDGTAEQTEILSILGDTTFSYGTNVDQNVDAAALLDGQSGAHPQTELAAAYLDSIWTSQVPAGGGLTSTSGGEDPDDNILPGTTPFFTRSGTSIVGPSLGFTR